MVRIPTIALLGLVALACSGSAAPGATVAITATSTRTALPTPAESPTPTAVSESPVVEDLTKRVKAVLALASQGNWLEAWEFYTLSFRESCPKETFAAQAAFGMNLFRGMLELTPNEPLEFRLMSVMVEGATALVNTQIFHQGEPLEYGAKDELDAWVLITGQWWNNVPPGPEGCVN